MLGDIARERLGTDAGLRRHRVVVWRGEAHYREALSLAERCGMRPLVAHCHSGLAKLHARAEQPERAVTHARTAAAMCRAMAIHRWLEQAEAEAERPDEA